MGNFFRHFRCLQWGKVFFYTIKKYFFTPDETDRKVFAFVKEKALKTDKSDRKWLAFLGIVSILGSSFNVPLFFDNEVKALVAPDLIISEYIEGSSYNKAIEIFNGTGSTVDLSIYSLEKDANGDSAFGSSYSMTGTLNAGDVFVLANSQADQHILDIADATGSGVTTFNGDDQVRLLKNSVEIDRIGVGSGVSFAQDVTYVRKDAIVIPRAGEQDPRNNGEWTAHPLDSFEYLGIHPGMLNPGYCDQFLAQNVCNTDNKCFWDIDMCSELNYCNQTFAGQTVCDADTSCTWDIDMCDPTSCGSHSESVSCGQNTFCQWNTPGGVCELVEDVPLVCGDMDQTGCGNNSPECSWTGTSCVETGGGAMTCGGVAFDDVNVCSGHGSCTGQDVCTCTEGWTGSICETEDLQTPTCADHTNFTACDIANCEWEFNGTLTNGTYYHCVDQMQPGYCSTHVGNQANCEAETTNFGCYWIETETESDCMPVDGTCSGYSTSAEACGEHVGCMWEGTQCTKAVTFPQEPQEPLVCNDHHDPTNCEGDEKCNWNTGSEACVDDISLTCGNGQVDGLDPVNGQGFGEPCDGTDLRGYTCATLPLAGFVSGNLSCNETCHFNVSECFSGGICGNGVVEPGEECDDGNTTGGDGCNAQCFAEIGNDTNMPPIIKGVKLISSTTVSIVFDRSMDGETTNVTDYYTIYTANTDNETITSAILQENETSVYVTASGATIVDGDTVFINGLPQMLSTDGTPTQGQDQFVIDGTAPRVLGAIPQNNLSGYDYIYIRFDDRLDFEAANNASNFSLDNGTVNNAQLLFYTPAGSQMQPSWMTQDMSDKIVVLEVSDVSIVNTVTISTALTDQAGNPISTVGGANVVSLGAGSGDPIQIANEGVSAIPSRGSWGMYMDGCVDEMGDTGMSCKTDTDDEARDMIIIPFTGEIDVDYLGVDSSGVILNIGNYIEVFESWSYEGSASSCAPGEFYENGECVGKWFGYLDQSYGRVTGEGNILEIYLQGYTDIHVGMSIKPSGIKGMNGLSAVRNPDPEKNTLPRPEFAEVDFVKVSKQGTTYATGDIVTLFFSTDMSRSGISTASDLSGTASKLRPTQMFPWQEHVWGSTGPASVAWGNTSDETCNQGGTQSDGIPDCLMIALGTGTTVKEGDKIMTMGLNSAEGTSVGFGGKIDSIPPTATATKTTSSIFINFSELVMDDDDDNDWSNNFSLNAGTIISVEPIFDGDTGNGMAGTGGMEDMMMDARKFEISVNDTSSTTVVNFLNIIDEGGLSAESVSVVTDNTPPTICKVIQNDWDGNGGLNGGDEVIFVFDNDEDATNGCTTDVNYQTITDPNTDFIIKRSGSSVSNPFGQGAGFWVDQWDKHAGELHINLGQGASVQSGDTIWAVAGAVTDVAGNAMQSATAQITLAQAKGGEITKVVYTDNGDSGFVDSGDVFVVHFNTAIDTDTLGIYDGETVTELDWGLPIEHNFEANYGGEYTFIEKTWGSATGTWNGDYTQLSITLGEGHVLDDSDFVLAYSVRTEEGGTIGHPGIIDLSSPELKEVVGDPTLAGEPTAFEAGDQLIFIFSEPMAGETILPGDLGIIDGSIGGDSTVEPLDLEGRIFRVTLGATGLNITPGITAFEPTSTVTDLNGNPDNTPVGGVTVSAGFLPPASNVSAFDQDITNTGIDGRDLTVTWTGATGAVEYLIYLLPEFVPFNPEAHNPVAIVGSGVCNGTCLYTGNTGLEVDSRSTSSTGTVDEEGQYFPLNEWDAYQVFVVTSDGEEGYSFPSRSGESFQFSLEYGSDGVAPRIEGAMPWDGATDIPTNGGKVNVKFNEMMDRESVEDDGNIKLEKNTNGTWSSVSAYVTYKEDQFVAIVEPASTLSTNTKYRVRVTTSVTDAGGLALVNQFTTHFTTSAATDSTSPTVETYFIDGMTTTSDIPRDTYSLSVVFSEDMDPSTFNSTSVSLSPSVAGSTVEYDPFMRSINYVLGGPMKSGASYSLTLSGTYLKDKAGNTLDGSGDGTASGSSADNYTLSFATANEVLSTTQPTITWVDSDGGTLWAGFSDKMEKSSVEKKSNWTITNGESKVDLQTATVVYDGFMNELRIEGLSLTAGNNYTINPTTSVLAMNGQSIDTGGSLLNFSPWSEDALFDADTIGGMMIAGMEGSFNGDMFANMGSDDAAENADIKTFMPISVWPMNQTTGKTTNYHINFPTTQALATGGKIVLTFPSSFDISDAMLATDSNEKLYFFNQDINGSGATLTSGSTFNPSGKVQISAVLANNQTKTITLTLAVSDGNGCTLSSAGAFNANCTDNNTSSTTMPYDFLDFELSGIKNGEAASIDWEENTGGYQVEIATKNVAGKTLEGPIKSMRFDIKKAGSGSISGKVTATDGTTSVLGARVFLDSPLAGHLETTSDASGNYSFTQLPLATTTNAWDGWYYVWVEAPQDSDYFGGQGVEVQLNSSNTTSTGNNVKLSSASNTITFTITHTGNTLDGQDVSIWAAGNNGWKEKKVTLDADGSTNTTMKVSAGMWDFGVMPYMEASAFGGGAGETDFIPPRPVQKNISGATAISFDLASASLTISGSVTDGTSGLANVNVYAYTPSGEGFGGHATTTSDGSYSIKVQSGTYTVGAFMPGLPSIPEKTIFLTVNTSGVNFKLVKSESKITGSVTDGTNAIQYASVNAWTSDGKFASAMTDGQGSYSLFVDPGTWSVDVFAPGYGKLEPASGVTTSNLSVTQGTTQSGINFSVAQATYYLISGQVKDGSGNGIANVFVATDEVTYSGGVTGDFTGNGNEAKTDSNGNFSIKVKANESGKRYKLHAWHPEYGDINPDSTTPLDVSSVNSTGNDFNLPTKRTMTISILNGDQLEDGDIDIRVAFVELHSTINDFGNKKKFKDIDLTAGDNTNIGTIDVQQGNGYTATMHIPGVGEFDGTLSSNESFAISANGTIEFDLGLDTGGTVLTFTGTIEDGSTSALEDAWVSVQNTETLEIFGTASNSSGDYSIKVPAGTYKLRVDKPNYKSPTSVSLSADDAGRTLTMTASSSTITGTIYKSDGATVAAYAYVWAEEVDGDGWTGTEADENGAYSLPVPAGTTWDVFARNDKGSSGSVSDIVGGATGKNITLSSTLAGASYIAEEPKVEPMTPADGGVMDDSDNTGVKLNIPANALGTGGNPGQIKASETTAIPKTETSQPLGGVGKEITATDSDGKPITNLNSDITIDLVYKKSEVEAFTGADNTATLNGLEELSTFQNAYWDSTTQNWNTLSSTKTAQVKNSSTDDWTNVLWDTFLSNIQGEGDNTGNGGGTQKDYYYDYKITLSSTTDHFTIFGAITGSDSTAPNAPTGLSGTGSNGSVSLDWTDNAEGDLLEYQVFRSTSSGFTCNDGSQINTSAVSSSAYTDASPSSNTSYAYYYKVSAVDNSGNVSNCSSETTVTYTYSSSSSSSSSGGGGGSRSSSLSYAPNTSSAYALPISKSNTEYYSLRPVSLKNTNGELTRPLKLESFYDKLTVVAPKETIVKDAQGKPFTGVINVPTLVKSANLPTVSGGYNVLKGVEAGASDGQPINFTKPFALTIPTVGVSNTTAKNLKVYYFNTASAQVELAGDGGILAADRGSITVQADHMSTFLVIDTKGESFDTAQTQGGSTSSSSVRNDYKPFSTETGERSVPRMIELPAPPFADTQGHWAGTYVEQLRLRGVVSGKRVGEYEPNNPLTRAELTKIAINAFSMNIPSQVDRNPFEDVEAGVWYGPYITAAQNHQIISGYPDGLFRPNNFVSRVEALKIILETSGLDLAGDGLKSSSFTDVEIGSWYEKYVNYAATNSMIDGFRGDIFKPAEPITRAEMARAIVVLWELMGENKE